MKSAEPQVFKTCAAAVQAKKPDDGCRFYHHGDYWCLACSDLQANKAIAAAMGIRAKKINQSDLIAVLASEASKQGEVAE